jgi:4-hydroxythreonine-4-phosphate dehydrogenase
MTNAPIAVTVGDPAGIGPEIVLKALGKFAGRAIVIGDYRVLEAARDVMSIDVRLDRVDGGDGLSRSGSGVRVLDTGVVQDPALLERGVVSPLGGKSAVAAVERAVELARAGEIRGIATGPINKEALREAGFEYIGHTEMLSELTDAGMSVTMFAVDRMKIFFHTRHQSLGRVISGLSVEGVVESMVQAHRCLESIGVQAGNLALAALNPHASDGGLFGDEEECILAPACEEADRRGIHVEGPVPADSVFHHALLGRYDAVVSLYHDQGHIAAKTYDFFRTVSVTFGLPFIRTSVDHGTAFDIAWKGVANPASMIEAVKACIDLSNRYVPVKL